MAVAVALTTQCPYGIELHAKSCPSSRCKRRDANGNSASCICYAGERIDHPRNAPLAAENSIVSWFGSTIGSPVLTSM
jgi:hypothetical protein